MKVLKIGAEWCSGCLVMRPIWSEVEKENTWLKTKYYDFDTNKDIMNKYEITDILPVFIFLDKDCNEFMRLNGEVKKNELIKIINENKEK